MKYHVIAKGGSSMFQSVWEESGQFDTEKEANEFADWIKKQYKNSDGGSLCIIKGECLREESWE